MIVDQKKKKFEWSSFVFWVLGMWVIGKVVKLSLIRLTFSEVGYKSRPLFTTSEQFVTNVTWNCRTLDCPISYSNSACKGKKFLEFQDPIKLSNSSNVYDTSHYLSNSPLPSKILYVKHHLPTLLPMICDCSSRLWESKPWVPLRYVDKWASFYNVDYVSTSCIISLGSLSVPLKILSLSPFHMYQVIQAKLHPSNSILSKDISIFYCIFNS